ncbi:MAG: outer membrane beta-barrel protein [Proteobacteria bacterium]|nr:outer membrane beta-barrel protein [Pseudomonadota bacterium]
MNAVTLAAAAALAAASWAPASLAQAPSDGWYLGSGLLPVTPRPVLTGPTSLVEPRDVMDPIYQQFGGFRFTETWSLVVGYTGGNRPAAGEGSIQANAWTFSGTGLLPITKSFSLQGRLGVAVPTAEFSLSSAAGALSSLAGAGNGADGIRHRMNMLWGVGGQYEFSPSVGLRLDYNSRYADDTGYSRARTDLWSINAVVRF